MVFNGDGNVKMFCKCVYKHIHSNITPHLCMIEHYSTSNIVWTVAV